METPYFKVKQLTDGVYAVIAKPGAGAMSNSGIIDLGKEVLIVDTFTTPDAAKALKQTAEKLTQKKVKYVFNTHYHGDHTFGNQLFQDAIIISTPETRDLHIEKNRIGDLETEKMEMEAYLKQLENRLINERNSIAKSSVTNQLHEMTKVLEAIDELKIIPPNHLFEEKLVLEGENRRVECYCFGGGHTESDAVLYLPEERILFAGDLVLEKLHPPIYNSEMFLENLQKLSELEIELIVTGHGGIVQKGQINLLIEYLNHLRKIVLEKENDLSTIRIPTNYADWLGVDGFKRNVHVVFNELKTK
ncbi:MBL fold metallo-hydrolase [Chungangia koreensis]|uniref:MBL fold metallo-hydrolase n=1 Tax=Chungangia koreensis TaxID=752657 RepID=A0ABV8X9L9_9LACT